MTQAHAKLVDPIITPNLHDGLLVGLALWPGRDPRITVRDVAGACYDIECHGATYFLATDVREGNIIYGMARLRGLAAEQRAIETFVGDINATEERRKAAQALVERMRASGSSVFSLESSFGCTIVCICTGVTVHKLDKE